MKVYLHDCTNTARNAVLLVEGKSEHDVRASARALAAALDMTVVFVTEEI